MQVSIYIIIRMGHVGIGTRIKISTINLRGDYYRICRLYNHAVYMTSNTVWVPALQAENIMLYPWYRGSSGYLTYVVHGGG